MPHTRHLEVFIKKAYEDHLAILAQEAIRDTLEQAGYYGGGFINELPSTYLTLARYADAMSELDDVMDFWGLGDSMDVEEDLEDAYPRDYDIRWGADDDG